MKSAGTQLRSYCYVVDCASAILTVLLKGEVGQAYNISNPDSVCTIRELAEAMAEAGGEELIMEEASEREKKGFNPMENSALEAEKLARLGWKGKFDLTSGTVRSISVIRSLDHR